MARIVFAMNQSLDGFVDHDRFAPDPVLFRHWVDCMRAIDGSIYGRRIYDIMRYWDTDDAGWNADEREFARLWRRQPKWVVSRTLAEVGPNATLVTGDLAAEIDGLKRRHPGEIAVAGPDLVRSLAALGLVDEYRLYVHPVVLGRGKPFFDGHSPRLRFLSSEPIGPETVRLCYVPA